MTDLPSFELLSASAGSGKTHQLTLRLLQRLVDTKGAPAQWRHMLALTFTNNAAREMRRRVLAYLKGMALKDPETIERLRPALGKAIDGLARDASALIEVLLLHYEALQVMTIDRFVGRWLRSVAHELGYPPSFELVLDGQELFDAAFESWAAEMLASGRLQELVWRLLDLRAADREFLWDPYSRLRSQTRRLYELLVNRASEPEIEETADLPDLPDQLRAELKEIADQMHRLIEQADGGVHRNFQKLFEDIKAGNLEKLVGRELNQQAFKKHARQEALENALKPLRDRLGEVVRRYVVWQAQNHPIPALHAYQQLRAHLRRQQREQGQVILGDGTRALQTLLEREGVASATRGLGVVPVHLLIDEFQDTSPAQWAVLRQLADHGLQQGGSLFVVGDTKQAIYGFRGGDWRIMAEVQERSPFEEVTPTVQHLATNYRSDGEIVRFVQRLFEERVPSLLKTEEARQFWRRSGLHKVGQEVLPDRSHRGYVTCAWLEDREAAAEQLLRELQEVRQRGYAWGDMAVLAPRNEEVVAVSQWLAGAGIPFLSHSSLDVRRRPVIDGVRALLRFLDTPLDDLAFASVLLGPLLPNPKYHSFLVTHREARPLYSAFREVFPETWERYFEPLFARVGYLPLYELVTEIYRIWQLFERFPEEQAALVKWLEVVREVEAQGRNALRDFLEHVASFAAEDDWDLPVAEGQEAVSVMTVHKAKGLEFPVVWVLWPLTSNRPDPWWMEEEGGRLRMWQLRKEYMAHDEQLARFYRTREAMAQIDELCRVYVALTRARHELHVRVVKSAGRQTSWLAPLWPEAGGRWGKPTHPGAGGEALASLLYPDNLVPRAVRAAATFPQPLDRDAVRLGDLCHAALARLHTLEQDVSVQVRRAVQAACAGHPTWDACRETAIGLLEKALTHPAVRPFFEATPGRTVHTEWEVIEAGGQARRIDRLIIDGDTVTVVDFKTGGDDPAHETQVRTYGRLVQALWPERSVETVLVYLQPIRVRRLS